MRTNARTVGYDVGRILLAVSLMPPVSAAVAAVNGEFYALPPFGLSALAFLTVGGGLTLWGRGADPPEKLEGMITAAVAWAVTGLLAGLPLLLVAWTIELDPYPAWTNTPPMDDTTRVFLRPINAVFEGMSGFTGTGLTMAVTEQKLPRSLHWWRSFTEWVGGVGVIVLTVAILARPGSGSYTLYESEARTERIHPSIVTTVQEIWKIYVGLTLGSILLFLAVGMPAWAAMNHGMTGIATGGFAVTSASIGAYAPVVQYAAVPVMVAGSIAFPVHYLIFRGEIRNIYADLQTRWVFLWFGAGSVLLAGVLTADGQYATTEATVRAALFQFVSATSNAGFGTVTVGGGTEQVWSAGATLVLIAGMVTGAAAGSTASGLKLIRVITLVRGTAWRVAGAAVPDSAVRYFQLGDRELDAEQFTEEYTEATVVLLLYTGFVVVGVAGLLWVLSPDHPLEYVVFEIVTAQSNVGLDAGITGPTMPDTAKAIQMLNMWVGRLEIIPVAVLLRSVFRRFGLYR